MRSDMRSSVSLSISPNSTAMSSIFCFCSAISASLRASSCAFSRRVSSSCSRARSSWSFCSFIRPSSMLIRPSSSSCIPLYWRVMSAATSKTSSFSLAKSAWYCSTRSRSSFCAAVACDTFSSRHTSWRSSDSIRHAARFSSSAGPMSAEPSPPSSFLPLPPPFLPPPFFLGAIFYVEVVSVRERSCDGRSRTRRGRECARVELRTAAERRSSAAKISLVTAASANLAATRRRSRLLRHQFLAISLYSQQ